MKDANVAVENARRFVSAGKVLRAIGTIPVPSSLREIVIFSSFFMEC